MTEESIFGKSRLHDLIRTGRKIPLKKGQIVQSSDLQLRLSLVSKGFIERSIIKADGSKAVQSIYGPSYVFPLSAVFRAVFDIDINSSNEVVFYEALTDAEIYWVDNITLKESLDKDPSLYKDFFMETTRRFKSNIQKLDNSSLEYAEKKVAHQLAFLAESFGEPQKSGGVVIQVPVTHAFIASMINVSRETASTAMAALKKKKLVGGTTNKRLHIPDTQRLLTYSLT